MSISIVETIADSASRPPISIPPPAPTLVRPFHQAPSKSSGKYEQAAMANAQPTIMAMSNDSTSKPSPIDAAPIRTAATLKATSLDSGEEFGRSILP